VTSSDYIQESGSNGLPVLKCEYHKDSGNLLRMLLDDPRGGVPAQPGQIARIRHGDYPALRMQIPAQSLGVVYIGWGKEVRLKCLPAGATWAARHFYHEQRGFEPNGHGLNCRMNPLSSPTSHHRSVNGGAMASWGVITGRTADEDTADAGITAQGAPWKRRWTGADFNRA
jgi:hypothetical protein